MSSFQSGKDFAVRTASNVPTNVPSVCPACRSSSVSTTSKSPDAESYWRCEACGEVWNVSRRRTMTGANGWRSPTPRTLRSDLHPGLIVPPAGEQVDRSEERQGCGSDNSCPDRS